MSTSLETATSGVAGGPSTHGPRLTGTSVGYAAWKPNMNVYLLRNGAEGIHTKVMTADRWSSMNTQAESWATDELDAAMTLLSTSIGSSSSSSTTTANESTKVSETVKAARKVVTQTVERSRKVYGIIYASLPVELRAQVAHIEQGFAHGLWVWLETKFQSTEEDHASDLLESWSTLHQDVGESFDAYRARVNELRALLIAADEPPSARMYTQTLTGRLLPIYKQAVLALKVGNKFKDTKTIDWNEVTALINAHERDTDDGCLLLLIRPVGALATALRCQVQQPQTTSTKCHECGQPGHKAYKCPSNPRAPRQFHSTHRGSSSMRGRKTINHKKRV